MLIGLTGKAGSGKNTVAKFIGDETGPYQTAEIAFAGPMKAFCREVFDWTDAHVDGPLKETPDLRYPRPHAALRWYERPIGFLYLLIFSRPWLPRGPLHLTPRYALQQLGTEWGRDCFSDTWIALARRRWRNLSIDHKHVLVTDMRFLNEAAAVTDDGGTVVKVVRPSKMSLSSAGAHSSETELSRIREGTTIVNDAGLPQLREKVKCLLEGLEGLEEVK